ncbi:hypothetical protein Q604_UNBC17957G0001, partial [human gut metagenome]
RKYKKRVAELEAAAAQIENTEISQKAQALFLFLYFVHDPKNFIFYLL